VGWAARSASSRRTMRRSCAMASKQPAAIQRSVCWWTAVYGGRSWGNNRHGQPARTIQRKALKSAREGYSRCGAVSVIKVR